VDTLATAATIMDATTRHQTDGETVDKMLTMYHKFRDNDCIITLNIIAAEAWRMESRVKDLYLGAIHHRIYRQLCKYGVIRHRVTHVAQITRYDESVKTGDVVFVNAGLKVDTYKASDSDIVNIDETYVEFDLVLGTTLAGRGERTIGRATT
jgi:hypothetical protein